MYHTGVRMLIGLGFFAFGVAAVFLLVLPARSIAVLRNPWLPDTPWTRLQIRALGLVLFLFAAVATSMIFAGVSKSARLASLSDFLLADLWLSFVVFWIVGVSSWIAWRFAFVRIFVQRHFTPERLENPAWERRMTTIFCSVLFTLVAIALMLAAGGQRSNNVFQ